MFDDRLLFERWNGNLLVLFEENRLAEIVLLANGRFQFAGQHKGRLRQQSMSHARYRFPCLRRVNEQIARRGSYSRWLSWSGRALSLSVYGQSATTQRK